MNLNQLKYAIEVDKQQSISSAARALFVSQPGVSAAIRDLEEELHITIFERLKTGVQTTCAGRLFIEEAKKIVTQADDLGKRFSFPTDGQGRNVRIAATPSTSVSRSL